MKARSSSLRSSALVLMLPGIALPCAFLGAVLTGGTATSPATAQRTGGTATSPATALVARQPAVPSWYIGTITEITRSLGTNTITSAYRDSLYQNLVGTNVQDVRLSYAADLSCPTNYPVTFASTNLLAPTNGVFGYVAAGAWSITATSLNQTNTFTGTNVVTSPGTAYTWTGNAANSVALTNSTAIDGMLSGQTATTSTTERLSTINAFWYTTNIPSAATMAGFTFVANTNAWCASVPMNAVSVWNNRLDSYGAKFQITAISPRHALCAAHAPPGIGTAFAFLATDGTTVVRTVAAQQMAADDVMVLLFNADLPSTVPFAHLLPANWTSYLSLQAATTTYPMEVPAIFPTQMNTLAVGEMGSVTTAFTPQAMFQVPSTAQRRAFDYLNNGYGGIWSGDSGMPFGLIIGGAFVPVGAWHYAGVGSGPFWASYLTQIDSTMTAESTAAGLGTNYQVTTVNLSAFTPY